MLHYLITLLQVYCIVFLHVFSWPQYFTKLKKQSLVLWEDSLLPRGHSTPRALSRWWQLKDYFIFTPKIGEDETILIHMFSDGLKPPTSCI